VCTTKYEASTSNPLWSYTCPNIHENKWSDQSLVTVEVCDMASPTQKHFIGGAYLNSQYLLKNCQNNKGLAMQLTGGNHSGSISFRVTWTGL
jgi:hypothetical protein